MTVDSYTILIGFDRKLNKVIQKLNADWNGKKIEKRQYDIELALIKKIIETNDSLIEKAQNNRSSKSWRRRPDLTKRIYTQDGSLETEMKTIALCLEKLREGEKDTEESIATISRIQKVAENLYLQTLAKWVNTQKVPIKELKLNEKQMLKLAPYLTYLNITDGEWDWEAWTVKHCTFSEEFIEKLLENSPNLNFLWIKNSMITGAALAALNGHKNLQQLTIEGCPAFNHPLFELQALQRLRLIIENCHSFNHPLSGLQTLEQLTINYCNNFNQPLFDLQALQRLTIKNCYLFNQPLFDLQALEQLTIKNCLSFNKPISKFENLQRLLIRSCKGFNQPLSELENLRQLTIKSCLSFNKSLSKVKNLQQLTMEACPAFNKPFSKLKNLHQLIIKSCLSFNKSLSKLENLQQLTMEACPAFSKPLSKLENLQRLTIQNCPAFNKSLSKLKKLQQLIIKSCLSFNKSLSKLENLQRLTIQNCPAFNPFNYSSNTALIYLMFYPVAFWKKWGDLSADQKEKYRKNNFEMDILLTLYDINMLMNEGKPARVIDSLFSSIRDQKNYIDYLKLAIQCFPLLTSYLIQNYREEIIDDIKKIGIPFDRLSKEAKLRLMPLFPPNVIQKLVSEIPREERDVWVQAPIQYERFSGAVKDVLKEIKTRNIDSSDESVFDNLGLIFREFLQKIPLKTIAALASDDSYAKVVLTYLPIMDEAQVTVVIPLLSTKHFAKYLKKQPLPIHKDLLSHATFEQKELYLQEDLIRSPDFAKWEKDFRPKLEKLIETFRENPTRDSYHSLELEWVRAGSSIGAAIFRYKTILKSLQEVLLKHTSEEFQQQIKRVIDEKNEQVKALEKELEEKKQLIMVELAKKLPEEMGVPEEFIDKIMGVPMENPWEDRAGHVLDKTTWDLSEQKHPFTRETLTKGSILPNGELQKRIDDFKKEHPEVWEKAVE